MHHFQAALDTPLDNLFFATLSVHGLHFTVCAPSKRDPFRNMGGNVGKTWVETWAKRARVWNPWWPDVVWFFVLAPGPYARKTSMKTR